MLRLLPLAIEHHTQRCANEDPGHPLHVRRGHRRQRETDIVNRHRDSHAGFELGEERIAAVWMVQRVTNRRFTVRQSLDRRIRIEHARADRQIFENEVFARRNDARCAVAVDVDHGLVRFSSELECHYFRFSIGQSWCRAGCRRRISGFMTAGWPTIDNIGRSLMLSV